MLEPSLDPNLRRTAKRTASVAFVGAFSVAALALAGWVLDIPRLRAPLPGTVAMNPVTAVLLMGASLSGWSISRDGRSPAGRMGRILSTIIGLFGLLQLFQPAVPLPLDTLLFAQRLSQDPIPSRMAVLTAAAFALLGLALVIPGTRIGHGWRTAANTPVFLIALLALVGYAYGAPSMYGTGTLRPMAANTALVFLLISSAMHLTTPDRHPVRFLILASPAGAMARRLIPAALLVPLIAGWLRLEAHRRQWFVPEVGTAVMALLMVAALVGLTVLAAKHLEASDAKRRSAEAALRRSLVRERTLAEADLVGVFTADYMRREVTEANAAFLRMLGYTKQDLPLHTDTITPPEWRDRTAEATEKLAADGITPLFEKEYVRKDGTRIPAIVGAAVLPDSQGECVGFVLDLTPQRRAESQARRLEAFLDSVIEHLPHMVFVKDARELRFVRLNRAAEELIGLPRGALLGKNDFDLFPREQAEFFQAKDLEVLRSGELRDIPEETLSTARGTRLLHTKKVPILSERGEPMYLLGVSEDITDRREMERQVGSLHRSIQSHAARLELANKELEAFSYSVSHDLRAPLRHMGGFADLLVRQNASQLDETGRRRLAAIAESARKMGQLIDDLLAFSRMGRVEIQSTRVDLNALVQSVRREYEDEAGDRRVIWKIGALPEVEGDPAMLRLVCFIRGRC